jgi:hypothetical protein
MARLSTTEYFKRVLLDFMAEEDPLYAMLTWLTERLMQLEAESKVGAQKGEHYERADRGGDSNCPGGVPGNVRREVPDDWAKLAWALAGDRAVPGLCPRDPQGHLYDQGVGGIEMN